jgi:glycosyltransferase involved in cell wall biosynthesis
MSRVLAYDVTRLLVGPLFLTPRGIDRVDLALARHVFADPHSPNLGILPTPWGVRAYPAGLMIEMLDKLELLWSEQVEADNDPQLQWLIEHVHSQVVPQQSTRSAAALGLTAKVFRQVQMLMATGLRLGRPVRRAVPRNAVYVNIGQLGLAVPPFFNWLDERRDVACAIMLHDVIPIEFPHLVSPAHSDHHARMVRTVADHADCLIYNTQSARRSVQAAMLPLGREDLPCLVRSLPLQPAFTQAGESIPELDGINYFIVVSTIEPRKNHALLLKVWQRLIQRMGQAAPHLVIVGALGYDSERILAVLEHAPLLRAKVHIVAGLSSKGLASLVLGATGMLCPSYAEGFGLPLLEARALGVPCIASDIAAHHEVANGQSTLLPPDDATAWENAISALPPSGRRVRPAIPAVLTEAAYCVDVLAFLKDC